jgi:hypothetical protein
MADKAAVIFTFISLKLHGEGVKNTRTLTYPHKKTSQGVISGELCVRFFLNNSVLYTALLKDTSELLIQNLNGRGVLVHLGTNTG